MTILHNKKGLSRIELFCIVGIGLIIAFLLFSGIRWYHNSMARGNDSLRVNTAESVASMNLAASGCVVNYCEGNFSGACIHADKDGNTHGYYDAVERKIFAEKTAGYNEYPEMKIGDEKYKGKVGTMVIEVTGSQDEITLRWVKGDNK